MNLVVENLVKKFDEKEVLKGADYTFEKGKIYGLLGRNGAGKTTLFNCINGDIDFEDGDIYIEQEGEKKNIDYSHIGYVFSTPILPEFLTGYEFLKFFTDINKNKLNDIKTPEEYADMFDFARSDLDRLIKEYSHGMKNKMQMICVFIENPDVILLDEPLTSLDVVAAHQMKQMLIKMKQGHIIIFSTHILQLAKDLCDEIVLLHKGELSGVAQDVYHSADFEEKLMYMLTSENDEAEEVKSNDMPISEQNIQQTVDENKDPYDFD